MQQFLGVRGIGVINRILCVCRNVHRINSTSLDHSLSLIASIASAENVLLSLVGNQMSRVIKVLRIVSRNMELDNLFCLISMKSVVQQFDRLHIAYFTSTQIMRLILFTLFDDRIESFCSRRDLKKSHEILKVEFLCNDRRTKNHSSLALIETG